MTFGTLIAGACCLIVGAVVASIHENRKTGTVGMVAAFIIGLAFHSSYLHEKARRNWKHPWNHKEVDQS